MKLSSFSHYPQLDAMDCGPSCLRMIAKYYGKSYLLQTLCARSFTTREGVPTLDISDTTESIGFHTSRVRTSLEQPKEDVLLPRILHWSQNHFVVRYDIKKEHSGYRFYITDPARQLISYNEGGFKECQLSTRVSREEKGAVFVFESGPELQGQGNEEESGSRSPYFFLKYSLSYRKQLIQLVLGMLTVSLLQFIFLFPTQSLVDVGIYDGNLDFITPTLITQLMVSVSRFSVKFIRSWTMLRMNIRISISLISNFLTESMKLSLHYFNTEMIGDIMRRIGGHGRVEGFLTGSFINTFFSFTNFFIFVFVLVCYSLGTLATFPVSNSLYTCWILMFMKYRYKLDIRYFTQAAGKQGSLIQLVTAMQEIKLDNCEKQKRWQRERIRMKFFKISMKGLTLGRVQQVGSVPFNQTTNTIISFIATKSVVEGNMTLGTMMSLTHIIGQPGDPIGSFIGFVQRLQDIEVSLECSNEIYGQEDEERGIASKLTVLPDWRDIRIENLSFSYDGVDRGHVLKDVNLSTPKHEVIAIVGVSGSGETTLIKLMLGFYTLSKGDIRIDETPPDVLGPHLWRAGNDSVIQDGFVFFDAIANNTVADEEQVNVGRLYHAVTTANIHDSIDSLPLGYDMRIGVKGNGINQRQRQCLLIARVAYKDPEFLFFDKATNVLDANNERGIMEHLHIFYRGKTAVVVAHHLNTARNADKIVALSRGVIVGEDTHHELMEKKGSHYQLVKNQLELGS